MNKFKVIKSLLMNLPVSLTMSFVAQWVNILHGHMQHFEWGSIAISFCFSYFIAFLIAFLFPRTLGALLSQKSAVPKRAPELSIFWSIWSLTPFSALL